ncbi:Glucooligosaccharide oxidase [Sphaerobolus stellatus SS14]|uniref:Glucooligosaccharide oxidase n=1 Tax=Sphaerobolus stellatus (strain SS14) TaxID=990650 RepID=A0A0C9VNT5_SPHS4|nr:Glucooligosaccharide oxidase [Sphaerobolus stellatus SS14]
MRGVNAITFLVWAAPLVVRIQGQTTELQSCLSEAKNMKISLPTDDSYKNSSQPYNLRVSPAHGVIVYPNSVDDVSKVVLCAAQNKMAVSARSGGHSYAGYALSGDVVVDLSNLKNISVDSSGVAILQTGNLLGELAQSIWEQGQRALPHGTCPYVGTGGHALYGGFGLFSRTAGLLLDRVKAAEVVLANGSIVTASTTSNEDLFWALRGGGLSFGIVTSWTFDTLAAPATTVTYVINFASALTEDDASQSFIIWQDFVRTLPNEMSVAVFFTPDGKCQMFTSFEGTYYGSEEQLKSILQALTTSLPLNSTISTKTLGWLDGLVESDGNLNTNQPEKADTFYAKSIVTTESIPDSSVKNWISYLYTEGLSSNLSWFAQADLYGGAIASISSNATAFVHRNAFIVYQFYASTSNALPPFPDDGITFVNNMVSAVQPNVIAAYANYIDPTLTETVAIVILRC